jgi:hypothetical protein
MQDASLFFRFQAVSCFHRRRRYSVLSPEWRHQIEDARRFIRASRADWKHRSPEERAETLAQIAATRTVYALGPRVRSQRPKVGNEP